MTEALERCVFDCNVFLQALGNNEGPAGRCVETALSGGLQLFISDLVLAEVAEVATRAEVAAKFRIPSDRVERLIANLRRVATLIADVPSVYQNPFDPDDSHYVDLACAATANLIVSRDKDLLRLMDQQREEGRDFHSRFPSLQILNPVDLLARLRGADDDKSSAGGAS
jgi:putative PIN family toxin of toxin-antitoxin system